MTFIEPTPPGTPQPDILPPDTPGPDIDPAGTPDEVPPLEPGGGGEGDRDRMTQADIQSFCDP